MDGPVIMIGSKHNKGGEKSRNGGEKKPSSRANRLQRRYRVTVDVYAYDGTLQDDGTPTVVLVRASVDIAALRRYSTALPELPTFNTTTDADAKNISFTIYYTGSIPPQIEAVRKVVHWMSINKFVKRPAEISSDFNGGLHNTATKLTDKVHVVAACEALGLKISPRSLVWEIIRTIRANAISADELQTIWEVLDHQHPITKAAIGNLTHCWRFGQLTAEHNASIEALMVRDGDLASAFDKETRYQNSKHAKYKHMKRAGGWKGGNGRTLAQNNAV